MGTGLLHYSKHCQLHAGVHENEMKESLKKGSFSFVRQFGNFSNNSGIFYFQLNGVDLTSVTAEQAMLELCKPTETVQILLQYNPTSKSCAI